MEIGLDPVGAVSSRAAADRASDARDHAVDCAADLN
jgi:hypothetical protein